MAGAPNDYSQTLAASSRPPDQPDSSSISIQELLNPVKCEGRSNARNAPGSSRLSKEEGSDAHGLSRERSSLTGQVCQYVPDSQAQNRARTRGVNPEPPQPAPKGDSPTTQYSAHRRISQTKSVIAPPVVSTSQPQSFFFNFPSGPTSTTPQTRPGTNASEMPASSAAAQNQHQMIVVETAQVSDQVPVEVQAAWKPQVENRRRAATASHRYRQRRKQKFATLEDLEKMYQCLEEKNRYLESTNQHLDETNQHHEEPNQHFLREGQFPGCGTRTSSPWDGHHRHGTDGMPRCSEQHLYDISKLTAVDEVQASDTYVPKVTCFTCPSSHLNQNSETIQCEQHSTRCDFKIIPWSALCG